MSILRRAVVLVVVLLALGVHAEAAAPATTVEDFYRTYIAHRPAGLPDGADLERLKPYLSAQLYQLIVQAHAYSREWAKKHPDEKPPFVDGDHFTSVFEGPKSFEIAYVGRRRSNAEVHVKFRGEPGTPEWTDVVVLKKESGRYVIDDVRFSGAGAFNPAGLLSVTLQARDGD
jgi:uncharacterized protein DUF3828